MTKKEAPILLIDGDILLYQATTSAEKEVEWDEDLWVMWSDHRDARVIFKDQLEAITSKVPGCVPQICLTHQHNFRKDVYPLYKANRKKTRKPMGYREFTQWVTENYTTIIKPNIEADDVMGILATKPGNNAIIVSADKDLMQIPGKHLVDGKVITVRKEDGDHFHFIQTLMGDAVDGYPGCPGVGKVKAEKLLTDVLEGQWIIIKETYEKNGLTEADALVQARCARILQWNDWDMEGQKVKLWQPSTA